MARQVLAAASGWAPERNAATSVMANAIAAAANIAPNTPGPIGTSPSKAPRGAIATVWESYIQAAAPWMSLK
jgi:hypothetical protein